MEVVTEPKKDNRFKEWMARVDLLLELKTGMDSNDLPDCSYHDWFDRGMSAENAARQAIKLARE